MLTTPANTFSCIDVEKPRPRSKTIVCTNSPTMPLPHESLTGKNKFGVAGRPEKAAIRPQRAMATTPPSLRKSHPSPIPSNKNPRTRMPLHQNYIDQQLARPVSENDFEFCTTADMFSTLVPTYLNSFGSNMETTERSSI